MHIMQTRPITTHAVGDIRVFREAALAQLLHIAGYPSRLKSYASDSCGPANLAVLPKRFELFNK